MFRTRILGATVAGLTTMAALVPGLARADLQPDEVPAGLNSAIEAYIEGQRHDYAGLCREVNQHSPLPYGEYCAFVLTIEHDIAEVSYGPVATNDISLVSFQNRNGSWLLLDEGTPVPPTATPVTPAATPTAPAATPTTAPATATPPAATSTPTRTAQPPATPTRTAPKPPTTGTGNETDGTSWNVVAGLAIASLLAFACSVAILRRWENRE